MRRACAISLSCLLVLAGCFSLTGRSVPEKEEPIPWRDSLNRVLTNELSQLPEMDAVLDSFMNFWSLHGVSLAVMRNDSLLYAHGYGQADASTPMTPGTTLRLASVSKLLTAVGIMRLQEQCELFLDTPVFGPYGVLNQYDSYIRDDDYYLITVEHLLRHQGGFSSRGGDPVFSPVGPAYEPEQEFALVLFSSAFLKSRTVLREDGQRTVLAVAYMLFFQSLLISLPALGPRSSTISVAGS